jgi:hypothetical protein
MPATAVTTLELITGQKMDAEEFLRRWEDLPKLKFAELIDGIVHVPSPLSLDHGSHDALIIWLASAVRCRHTGMSLREQHNLRNAR